MEYTHTELDGLANEARTAATRKTGPNRDLFLKLGDALEFAAKELRHAERTAHTDPIAPVQTETPDAEENESESKPQGE
jgi:hypothetical protein